MSEVPRTQGRRIVKKVIYGCEADGDTGSPYLTRWTLLATRFGSVYLHLFHRSDSATLHDHPWNFVSVILWRGYVEVTERGTDELAFEITRRRKWPGMVLVRPATWTHRVELVKGRPAVSLVFVGRRVREWGFHTPDGWTPWREFFRRFGC